MADLDRQKEVVNTIRTIWLFLIGVLFGEFAYLFQNFDKLSNTKIVIIEVVILLNTTIIILLSQKLKNSIDKLKDL